MIEIQSDSGGTQPASMPRNDNTVRVTILIERFFYRGEARPARRLDSLFSGRLFPPLL